MQTLDLGRDGEAQFERLRACLEYGQGFELFLCGFETPRGMAEVKRRLAATPPPGNDFEILNLEKPDLHLALAGRLAGMPSAVSGRKVIFASASGWEEDLKGEWARSLRHLNERRNITIRECPNAIVLAGPPWLPWLAHDVAPDLWSIRTAVFTFPDTPPSQSKSAMPEVEPWRSGQPMAHELQPSRYYEELAAVLEASRRPSEQGTCGRLLLRASAAARLRGDYNSALQSAMKAGDAFVAADEEFMVAVSKGYIADILQQRGETDEALRIRREEQLPVYERLGDVRERAVTMGQIADILQQRGETDEALRILIKESLPEARRTRDIGTIAYVYFLCARIRLGRDGLKKGEKQTILDELGESFTLNKKLQRANGVALVGSLLGQILAAVGQVDKALSVLDESATAFDHMGQSNQAARVLDLQKEIRKKNE